MRIVFREPVALDVAESPFMRELRNTAQDGAVDIACPYISVQKLMEITAGDIPFRVLTDAKEWLRAFPRPMRRDVLDFIARHGASVRDYKDLHAKVAVSPRRVFFGSANFTEKGLEKRQELCAVSERPEDVAAVQRWFDALWSLAEGIVLSDLEAFARLLPDQGTNEGEKNPPLSPPIPKERVLRGASGDLYDHDSRSHHLALEQLAVVLARLGFKVVSKRAQERTLRVYPVKIPQHPLLNPRFRLVDDADTPMEGLVITVLAGDLEPDTLLSTYASTPECTYVSLDEWIKPYYLLGEFVLPVQFTGPERACDIDFQRLERPLASILGLLGP